MIFSWLFFFHRGKILFFPDIFFFAVAVAIAVAVAVADDVVCVVGQKIPSVAFYLHSHRVLGDHVELVPG